MYFLCINATVSKLHGLFGSCIIMNGYSPNHIIIEETISYFPIKSRDKPLRSPKGLTTPIILRFFFSRTICLIFSYLCRILNLFGNALTEQVYSSIKK